MTVKEYLEKTGWNRYITFIRARARKDARTPFFHPEYQTTPLLLAYEWKSTDILNSIVLNDRQASITWLSGVDWNNDIKRKSAKCLLIIRSEDFKKLLPDESQRKDMIEYIDRLITNRINV